MQHSIHSEVTEKALTLIYGSRADYYARANLGVTSGGRIFPTGRVGGHDAQLYYVRIVTAVEMFVDSIAEHLLDEHLDDSATFAIRKLVDDAKLRSSNGWEDRSRIFKETLGINFKGCSKWSDIDAAIAVRNTIAHGLGALTPRQRNNATRNKIRSLGIEIVDSHVVVDGRSIDRLTESSVQFVRSLDQLCAGRPRS